MTRSKGFTLIELLIVVAIIAILAAIAVPNFLEAQTRSKVSRAQADMRSLAVGIEAYAVDNNKYPPIKLAGYVSQACPDGSALLGKSVTGGPGCGVSSRLIWITTPISYVTSVFTEAFNVKQIAGGVLPISGEKAEFYDTYDFIAAQYFIPGSFPGGSPGSYRGAGITSGAAWRLSSAGPDLIQAYGGNLLSAGPGDVANIAGVDYDATNGTVSTGDIVRIGGGPGPGETKAWIDRVAGKIGP